MNTITLTIEEKNELVRSSIADYVEGMRQDMVYVAIYGKTLLDEQGNWVRNERGRVQYESKKSFWVDAPAVDYLLEALKLTHADVRMNWMHHELIAYQDPPCPCGQYCR